MFRSILIVCRALQHQIVYVYSPVESGQALMTRFSLKKLDLYDTQKQSQESKMHGKDLQWASGKSFELQLLLLFHVVSIFWDCFGFSTYFISVIPEFLTVYRGKVWMQHATGRLQRYTLPLQHGQYSISSGILFGGELCWKFLEDSENRTTEGCFGNVHLKTVLLYTKAASGWKWAARLLSSWPLC